MMLRATRIHTSTITTTTTVLPRCSTTSSTTITAPPTSLVQQSRGVIRVFQQHTDPADLRRDVLKLYRDILRSLPWMKKVYFIHIPVKEMARCMENEFRKYQSATDPDVIDNLLLRGEMEFEEAIYHFKQRGHFYRWFKIDDQPIKPKFANPEMEAFFGQDRTFPLDIPSSRPLETNRPKPSPQDPLALASYPRPNH